MTENEVVTEKNGEQNKEENAEEETYLEAAIIRQVEYYFGDLNLPRDKFLREQVKLEDGWVPLEILTRFNRLAKLTKDVDVIAKALNKSDHGIIEMSEDNKKVRRNPEMPVPEMNEERRKELMARTVYAKGFPIETQLDDILKFFKQYGDVENVIMRRYLDHKTKKRNFKGSCFSTFKTKEQAETFMNTKDLKYEESNLITKWQDSYLQEKQEEYAAKKAKKDKKNKHSDSKDEKEEFKLPIGAVLHLSEGSDKMTREDIKAALAPLDAEIAFIDFKSGDKEGWVRLTKENSAKELLAKMTDGKVKICETDVTFRILEGDEEKLHLDKNIEEILKRRKNQKNNRSHKGKHFKGGKQGGRKRRHDHNDGDAPPRKVKVDS